MNNGYIYACIYFCIYVYLQIKRSVSYRGSSDNRIKLEDMMLSEIPPPHTQYCMISLICVT